MWFYFDLKFVKKDKTEIPDYFASDKNNLICKKCNNCKTSLMFNFDKKISTSKDFYSSKKENFSFQSS